jgi:hypothetical protein
MFGSNYGYPENMKKAEVCKPDYEEQAKRAISDIKKVDNVFEAMKACPHIDVDYTAMNTVIGGLYRAKVAFEDRRDKALLAQIEEEEK